MLLQEARKPITIISQIFGVAPFVWGKLGDLSVPLNLLLLVFCIISNLMFLVDSWVYPEHTLPIFMLVASMTGITSAHTLHRLAYLYNRHYLKELLCRLQQVQMLLEADWDYSSSYWCSVALLVVYGLILASYCILRLFTANLGVNVVSFYISSFTLYLVELQFVAIVHVILQLFRQVNEDVSRNRKDVRYLMKVHAMLCDMAQEVSNEFGLPLIVSLIFAFFGLTSSLYFVLLGLLQGRRVNKDIYSSTYISWYWPVIMIPHLWIKYRACHLAAAEANRTGILVHRRLIDEWETEVRHELGMFSLQLLHRKFRFTAAGFVTLDLTLLQSIVSAVTTYLIILMQFQLFM